MRLGLGENADALEVAELIEQLFHDELGRDD